MNMPSLQIPNNKQRNWIRSFPNRNKNGCHSRGKHIKVNTDSQSVARQIAGKFTLKEDKMVRYKDIAIKAMDAFRKWEVIQLQWSEKVDAEALAHLGAAPLPKEGRWVYVEM